MALFSCGQKLSLHALERLVGIQSPLWPDPQCLVGLTRWHQDSSIGGWGEEESCGGEGEEQSRCDSPSITDSTSFPSETNLPAALGEGLF